MKAGRELDALVAEKLMGFCTKPVCESVKLLSEDEPLPDAARYCKGLHTDTDEHPRYSTKVKAAWEVIEKLQAKGYRVTLYITQAGLQILTEPPGERERVIFRSIPEAVPMEKAPHVICLAALKAVGYPVEEGA